MRKYKHPKVVYKKLGRQKAYGMYYSDGTIEIDPRLKGEHKLDILIHEELHHLFPLMPEEEIESKASKLANFLWQHKLRFIE